MKVQKLIKLLVLIVLLLLLTISCNTAKETGKSNLDKTTGQLIKETTKLKSCLYSDGSICNQTCCKTGNACGDQPYSYRKCDIYNGIWDFIEYKNSDCSSSCIIINEENKEGISEKLERESKIKTNGLIKEQKTVIEKEEKVLTCSSGWKCKDVNYRGYQFSDCSWSTLSYCENGCENGDCKRALICAPNTFKCDEKILRKCNEDGSYWGYYEFCFDGCENDKCLSKKEIKETTPSTSTIVSEVIDGDTIKLQNGERVRLIGTNTPEAGQYYHLEAKNKLKELVEGKSVTLEKDVSNIDKYGRLLCMFMLRIYLLI